MGVYGINCYSCNEPFVWWSGDLDQRCPACKRKAECNEKEVYLCGIDFQHDVGEAPDGSVIYPNIEDLKRNAKCWESCGIVKCKISLEKWITKQDLKKNSITADEFEKNHDIIMLKNLEERKNKIDRQIKRLKNKLKKEK